MTVDLIVQSQKGDNYAVLKLIRNFDPLLKKYAFKLHYDDAYNDLLSDFIELLSKIRLNRIRNTSEGILVSYIRTAIHSSYIKKLIGLKKAHNFIPFSALSGVELYYAEAVSATSDTYGSKLELIGIDQILTKSETNIIRMIYFYGYTVTEIAAISGISKQAISKKKRRALQKLAGWLQK